MHREPAKGEDTFHMQIVEHILEGNSCTVLGAPGTGKSHLVRALRDALRERGDRCEVIAPSNAAARIVGGSTIHAFLTRISQSAYGFQGVLIIDEIDRPRRSRPPLPTSR